MALAVVAGAMMLIVGCSSDGDVAAPTDDAAASTSDATTTTTAADTGGSAAPSDDEDQPDDTTAAVDAESLGLPPEIAECVAEADPDAAVGEAVTGCVRAGPMATGFMDGLAEQHPGRYSGEELACLGDAYGQLSSEDVGYLVSSGLLPDEEHPEADEVIAGLYGDCGVEPPG